MNNSETPKVGDILYSSWGYDQTNIDWYQVVRTSKASVWIRSIAADLTDDKRHVVPVSGVFTDLKKAERVEDENGNTLEAPCTNLQCLYRSYAFDQVEHDCPVVILTPNPPMRKKIKPAFRDEGYQVNITAYSSAWLWDGAPKYDTIAAGDPGH